MQLNPKHSVGLEGFDTMCRDYVSLVCSPPNAWGQNIHPKYGQSHHMLIVMAKRFGKKRVVDNIANIFEGKLKGVT